MPMNRSQLGDFFGAFADAAILFPLLSLLSLKAGFALDRLFLSTGVAYVVAGFFFKIPMPVQPLKSIAIAAVSVGATKLEVQFSGLILGLYCLGLLLLDVNRLSLRVPSTLIQSIQFALGIMLIQQAYLSSDTVLNLIVGLIVALTFILLDTRLSLPILGIFATVTLALSFTETSTPPVSPTEDLRWSVLAGLVLPQMVLTLGNSILGTASAARIYFEDKADRVTPKNLLLSVGIGNILSSLVQGLPYCHGAGGLTAHVKGGANTSRMNFIIGGLLIFLGAYALLVDAHLTFSLPALALTALLATVGYHHLFLARSMWKSTSRMVQLFGSALIVILTKNLLYVFAWALLVEVAIAQSWVKIKE